ncbi:tetratricopeptide repeat-containing sensor histidine kinase [Pontibacter beigongshangensis]|uniref:tetratricopeptide repeat-containing sensor histidine kinase n=1 Tax=Pontibacter beigongshangensis TaxID=2574733 RepID=UPI00164F47FE|nr:sensor histidine kinase [Pontibacter beigongshangensis]
MKRIGILCMLLLLAATAALAQNDLRPYLDSLQKELRVSQADTARARIMGFISQAYTGTDSAKAFSYARQAIALQQKHQNRQGLAFAYYTLAYAQLEHGSLKESEKNLLKARELVQDDLTKEGRRIYIRSVGNLAYVKSLTGKPDEELQLLLGLLPDIEQAKDSSALAVVNANLGAKLINTKAYGKALPYLQKAATVLQRLGMSESEGFVYLNTVECLLAMDSVAQTKPYLDKAKACFELQVDSDMWGHYYTYLGLYHHRSGNLQQALQSYAEAEQLALAKQQTHRLENIWKGLYELHMDLKQYPQARLAIQKLYRHVQEKELGQSQLYALESLARLAEKTGDHARAYTYLKAHKQLSDSVRQAEIDLKISEMEARYQAEKTQSEMLVLQNTNKEQQLKLERSRLFLSLLLGGSVILLLLLLIGYLLYRHKQRLARQLHEQQVRELEQEKQLITYNAMLQGQEQERTRVARDLHDGLGGMLAGVKLQLAGMADRQSNQTPDMDLYKVISQLDQSANELRRIARNMMPESLLKFGLETALKDLCANLATPATPITLQAYDLSPILSQDTQITVYRIIQELVANAVKHADASQILVQCSQHENQLLITVEDDGRGFDLNALRHKEGIGLSNVRNRIGYLKGKVDIDSAIGQGTTVNIEINLPT